jgi:hypothetical protein
LRRFITPIGFGEVSSNSNVSRVFAQAFFEKACGQAIFLKRLDFQIQVITCPIEKEAYVSNKF